MSHLGQSKPQIQVVESSQFLETQGMERLMSLTVGLESSPGPLTMRVELLMGDSNKFFYVVIRAANGHFNKQILNARVFPTCRTADKRG
ncbi:unnamed protein product [Anisakis simplex]|uniref:Cystatin domain-containing protein n=1 Tax=Anisakis simplex TaxID=6269 RepID=A0A0M3K5X0_ANISI|nr:unnamed protein product [Anisakis simplex]